MEMGCFGDDVLLEHLRQPREEVAVHAAACAACATSLRELAPLAAIRPERLEPSAATREAIFRAARRKPTTRRVRVRRFAPVRGGEGRLAIAAAAVALIALLVGYAFRRPAAPPPVRELPRVVRTPEPEPAPPLPPIEKPKDLVPPAPPPPPREETPRPAPVPPPPPPPAPPPAPVPAPRPTIVEAPPPAPRPFARVARVSGSADVRKGDVVLGGQAVSCKLGTVLLELDDDSQVVLRAGASVVGELGPEGVVIRLSEGEVACSVRRRPERRFAVETAHGAAVVRGTMFSVKTQASGATVVVSRGRVQAGDHTLEADQRSRLVRGTSSKPEAVAAERLLEWAGLREAGTIWLSAAAAELRAPMSRGRLDGALAPEPLFAAVDARTLPGWGGRFLRADGEEGGAATWIVEIPDDGVWQLWGRMFHPASGGQLFRQGGDAPDNDPNSFYVSVDGGPEKVFGNHKGFYRRWHWAGDGGVEQGPPAGLRLTLRKGRHTLRIRPRDAVETPSLRLATRLDLLCLSPDPDYRPRDEDYAKK